MSKKALMAGLLLALIVITIKEKKKLSSVQSRARDILYPGDNEELVEMLLELKVHDDPESRILVKQIESRLRSKGQSIPR